MSIKARWMWLTTAIWIIVDQATKIWVQNNLVEGVDKVVVIPGFFNIVHAENPGAAFSFLADFEYRHYVFSTFAVIAVYFIIDVYRRLDADDWFQALSLGLILSGAAGNLIDRLDKQTVTDFVLVYYKTWQYPAFNVADSTLLVGVILYFFASAFNEGKEEVTPAPDTSGA